MSSAGISKCTILVIYLTSPFYKALNSIIFVDLLVVNSSHGLKAGASLLLLRFYAVIALWHRGAFRGNFRFPFHWPKLTSDSRCGGSDLIGQVRGVPSLLCGIVWRIQNLPEGEVIDHPSST